MMTIGRFDKENISITCIDCKERKAPAATIGSWQCEDCQEQLFNRVRDKAGRHKNKILLKVGRLMNAGLKGTEIVKETGLGPSSVYRYMRKIKGMEVT